MYGGRRPTSFMVSFKFMYSKTPPIVHDLFSRACSVSIHASILYTAGNPRRLGDAGHCPPCTPSCKIVSGDVAPCTMIYIPKRYHAPLFIITVQWRPILPIGPSQPPRLAESRPWIESCIAHRSIKHNTSSEQPDFPSVQTLARTALAFVCCSNPLTLKGGAVFALTAASAFDVSSCYPRLPLVFAYKPFFHMR